MKTIVRTLLIIAILFDVQIALAQLRSSSADIPIVYNWGDKSSYVMDSGIPNTLEYTQRVKAIDDECFVALSRDTSGNFSYLELLKDTTQNEQYMMTIPNSIATDIDVGEKYIYFCGYVIGSPSVPMLGRIYKSDWFTNTATGFEFTLLTSNTNVLSIDSLTRINVYNDYNGQEHIVCLGVRTDTTTSSQCSCIVAIEDDRYVIRYIYGRDTRYRYSRRKFDNS